MCVGAFRLLPLCICHANPGPRGRACRPIFDAGHVAAAGFPFAVVVAMLTSPSAHPATPPVPVGPGDARVDDAVLKQPVY